MPAIADILRARGRRFDAVTKAITHYVGSSSPADFHDNMSVRNAYYPRPGPPPRRASPWRRSLYRRARLRWMCWG